MPPKTSTGKKSTQSTVGDKDNPPVDPANQHPMDIAQLQQSNADLLKRVDQLAALVTKSLPNADLPSTSTAGHGHNTRGAATRKTAVDQDTTTASPTPPTKRGRPAKKPAETVTSNSELGHEDVLEFAKSTGTDPVDWGQEDSEREQVILHRDRVRVRNSEGMLDSTRKRSHATMDHAHDDLEDNLDEYGFHASRDTDVYKRRSIRIDERNISGSIDNALRDRFSGTTDCLSNILVSGHTIDDKVKSLIWRDQYIDLMSLDSGFDQGGTSASQGGPSTSHTKIKKVPNFAEWSRLFHIYCSVYVIKHPESASEVFSYVNQIQALHNRRPISFLWRAYDEHFRKIRACAPTLPWHVRHQQVISQAEDDLNLENLRSNFRAKSNKNSNVKQTSSNVCYDYNNKGKICSRSNCPYQHKCAKCSLSHEAHLCRKDNNNQQSKPDSRPKK